MNVKILSIILSLLLLGLIIELTRREKLTFKYAFGWILVSAAGLILAVFDHLIYDLSTVFGFALPSNFIFFATLCGFVFLSLVLTIFLCQLNGRSDKMAQKIGLLEYEIEQLKKKSR